MVFVFTAAAASADEYKFPNGISFTYPSGYQMTEMKQPPTTLVSLMDMSDPTVSFTVAITDNAGAGVIPEGDIDESEIKKSMPEGAELITCKKTKVAGKDAILTESKIDVNGVSVFSHSLLIVSDSNLVSVGMAVMDSGKVDAARKVAEGIENSIKF
jgi:hypothetical protein